ncbi:MAG: helix-turn-helix domain-containing protein [Clostridiales Family XIII bacterium]|jgi:putative transcriptional regulator|nr:helix-turn-helix domain-containing protein [Clostridiales Family XIII bacterium]
MKNNYANSIIAGLQEAIDDQDGKIELRRIKAEISPVKNYSAADIRRIRENARMSQAAFAFALGVSKKTIEAWEAGTNHPRGSSGRLLEIINKRPQIFKELLK